MKVSFRLLPVAALLALPAAVHAQNELSNFTATGRGGVINTFATDYQTLGINPANLGRPGEATVAFTIGEFGAGLASRSLGKDLFKRIISADGQTLTAADKRQLVDGLTGENALNLNVDITTLGLSFNLPNGLGGIAISNRQRLGAHLALNHNFADIIVNGKYAQSITPYYDPATGQPTAVPPPLVSTFLNGTAVQMAWTSEYNVAYGVRVIDKSVFKASIGAGYRYIQGLGVADVRATDGNLSAYSALSPVFDVNYGNLANNPQFNATTGTGIEPVGHGHGYDVGIATEIGKFVRVGASLTDMGTMTWTGNVVSAQDQKLQATTSNGINSYDVIKEIVDQFDTDQKNLFQYDAQQERKVELPAKMRLGAGVRVSDLLEVGVDYTAPLNKVAGNLTAPFIGLGLDFKPVSWVRLSTGVSGGAGYGTSLPLGVTLVTPVWEFGVSSRDVTGYFNDKAPYYSAALGFLRFKFGGKS